MRPAALLLACLALVNVVFHEGVVRHERCAQHGEMVDVLTPEAQHADIAHHGFHAHTAPDDDHEHCPLGTPASAPHSCAAPGVQRVATAPRELVAPPPTASAPSRLPWRTAPSTGPPHAA